MKTSCSSLFFMRNLLCEITFIVLFQCTVMIIVTFKSVSVHGCHQAKHGAQNYNPLFQPLQFVKCVYQIGLSCISRPVF